MQPVFGYIAEPYKGKRYNDTIDFGDGKVLFLSATIEEHRTTNRIAKIISKASNIENGLEVGEYALVHHNTFRQFYDQQGNLSYGANYIGKDQYMLDECNVYMKSKDAENWEAMSPYIFVEPVKAKSGYETFELEYGVIRYSSNPDYKVGDRVKFTADSEYEFRIGDEVFYRMKYTDVIWKE